MDRNSFSNPARPDQDIKSLSGCFTDAGGVFVTSAAEIAAKLRNVRALVFDWDGVFNGGFKSEGLPSTFNEADSMGTNMLRYGLWRQNRQLPTAAVISGEDNHTAFQFARREHFQDVYLGLSDKRLAIKHLCSSRNVKRNQIICVFDDINDLGMAKMCGLRYLVHRVASPLFEKYAAEHKLCDYITGNDSLSYAVREISELSLGLLGIFDIVVDSRVAYDKTYQEYFRQRQATQTDCYTQKAQEILSLDHLPIASSGE